MQNPRKLHEQFVHTSKMLNNANCYPFLNPETWSLGGVCVHFDVLTCSITIFFLFCDSVYPMVFSLYGRSCFLLSLSQVWKKRHRGNHYSFNAVTSFQQVLCNRCPCLAVNFASLMLIYPLLPMSSQYVWQKLNIIPTLKKERKHSLLWNNRLDVELATRIHLKKIPAARGMRYITKLMLPEQQQKYAQQ